MRSPMGPGIKVEVCRLEDCNWCAVKLFAGAFDQALQSDLKTSDY